MRSSSRRTAFIAGLFLASSFAVQAQSAFLLPQGQHPAGFGGSGLSSAFGVSAADVGGVNPAALGVFEQTTVGISYGVGTATEVAGDVEVGPANGLRPRSAAGVVPLGAWTLGISYTQRYASRVDTCVPRQTPENPDIEPVSWCAEQTARAEVLASQAAYRTVGASGSTLDVGVRLGVGRGSMESQIDDVTGTFSAWGVQLAAGMSYHADGVGLAVGYESALRVEGEMEREGGLEPAELPGDGPGRLPSHTEIRTSLVSGRLPARLSLSATIDATPALGIGADLHHAFWQMEDADRYENQTEVAAWARLDLSDRALVSIGAWRQGGHPAARSAFVDDDRAIYLTLGGALTLDRFRLDAVVADSRLLSAEQHRQTVVKLGASVRL